MSLTIACTIIPLTMILQMRPPTGFSATNVPTLAFTRVLMLKKKTVISNAGRFLLNVNGLRDTKKRDFLFNWQVSKNYDLIGLQETYCVTNDTCIER